MGLCVSVRKSRSCFYHFLKRQVRSVCSGMAGIGVDIVIIIVLVFMVVMLVDVLVVERCLKVLYVDLSNSRS